MNYFKEYSYFVNIIYNNKYNNKLLFRFFEWLDRKFEKVKPSRNNLLVYPEGHRNFGSDKPLVLKKGMIRYAYERKYKVQIVMSFGNEALFNEKKLIANFK